MKRCCRGREAEEKKHTVLTFKTDDLLYDIRNYAYVEGDIMEEQSQHSRHTLMDIGEEGNVDRVYRMLDQAHALVCEMLYPYTKTSQHEFEVRTSKMRAPGEYVVGLEVPASFSHTTINVLRTQIHEYMVCRVLYDWLAITKPESAEAWLRRALEAEEEIRRAKDRCGGIVRRPLHPF